jgi:parvulin-like peptidyl-prolyl isomerase
MSFVPALLVIASMAQAVIVDRIAATVDDEAITESDVRKAIATSPLRPAPDESPEAFRGRVLDALVDQRLSYADALRFGPAAPDPAAVEESLAKLQLRLKSEGKDPEKEFAAAGLTPEEVRASVERQLLIQRYLQERFRPVAFADDARAREEYEKFYVPEVRAANRTPEPFEKVDEEMRRRAQQRTFEEEVEKWMKELREKARIVIYKAPASISPRTPTPISSLKSKV